MGWAVTRILSRETAAWSATLTCQRHNHGLDISQSTILLLPCTWTRLISWRRQILTRMLPDFDTLEMELVVIPTLSQTMADLSQSTSIKACLARFKTVWGSQTRLLARLSRPLIGAPFQNKLRRWRHSQARLSKTQPLACGTKSPFARPFVPATKASVSKLSVLPTQSQLEASSPLLHRLIRSKSHRLCSSSQSP